MSEESFFVAEFPDGAFLGTWPADEVRRRLVAGSLSPTYRSFGHRRRIADGT